MVESVNFDSQRLAFQILIDGNSINTSKFTEKLHLNIQSFRITYPEFRHHIFYDEEIRALLQCHFDQDVVTAYQSLLPYAYKADLARYCLLYQFGGIYSDLSYLHIQPVSLFAGKTLVAFREALLHK